MLFFFIISKFHLANYLQVIIEDALGISNS